MDRLSCFIKIVNFNCEIIFSRTIFYCSYIKLFIRNLKIRFILASALIFCMLGVSCSAFSKTTWHINSIVALGDGSIDNGRSFMLYHIPISPPFWQHRFSNGPTWVESFAYRLRLIPDPLKHPNYNKHKFFLDYGYYYATATEAYANKSYYMTLDDEISEYRRYGHPYPANTLAIIDMGSNDMMSTGCMQNPMLCLSTVSKAETNGLMRLCKMGVKHFLITSPSATISTPNIAMLYSRSQEVQLLELQANYDRQFASIKSSVESNCKKSQVVLVSDTAYMMVNKMKFNQPIHIPCYNNINKQNGEGVYDRQIAPVCSDPNQYFFFDVWFGSYRNNKMYADAIYKQVGQEGWNLRRYKHWWQRIF